MKRLIAVLLVTIMMVACLTGCAKDRKLYRKVKLSNYVEVEGYKGIEIDTTTDEFAAIYDEIFKTDIEENGLFKELKEGVVVNGDIVNLDYEGKLDGVAFEGGTAKGYDLEIGSKTFIDDFEEELIGVAVGETKDVTAKFPENYGKEELNGKEAIFTCKINSIKRAMTIEEAYEEMDFATVDDYKNDIKKRAIEQKLLDTVIDKSKIIDYPSDDSTILRDAIYEFYVEIYKDVYSADLEQILAQNGKTVDQYKSEISTKMVPEFMDTNMVMYYILDTEGLTIKTDTDSSKITKQPVIAESYAVQDTVIEFLYENAIIK